MTQIDVKEAPELSFCLEVLPSKDDFAQWGMGIWENKGEGKMEGARSGRG